MVARELENTGATVRAQGEMYKAVNQSVLLYNSESWVVTVEMIKVLEGLYHQAEQQITWMTVKHRAGGEWGYPPVVEATEDTGIHPIGEYIRRQQATTA